MFHLLKNHPRCLNTLLFLFCVLTAFVMRTHNYNREVENMAKILRTEEVPRISFFRKFFPVNTPNFMPYTIESAMMFGYIQDIAAGKSVPASDKNLHGLEDIPPYSQMIMGLEWFIGWSYRLKAKLFPPPQQDTMFEDNHDLANFTALELRLWISLSSGFLFLLLLTLRCSRKLALFGGIFHAVAISAIARSTGQDIIRGNFTLPLLTLFLLLFFSASIRRRRWKLGALFLTVFTAFSTWDLCLGFFSAFTLWEICRLLFGGRFSKGRIQCWIVTAAAILLSSLLIPFNRTYQLIMSPLLTVILPLLFLGILVRRKSWKVKWLVLAAGTVGLLMLWNGAIRTPYYDSHYSHFKELTKAKLHFSNVKPLNPKKLSYDARIMWTPAMHSADARIFTTFFPSIGVLTGAGTKIAPLNNFIRYAPVSITFFFLLLLGAPFFVNCASFLKRDLPRSVYFLAFTIIFLVGFIYIVRYHEFLIIYLAVALALLLDDVRRGLKKEVSPGRWAKAGRIVLRTLCGILLAAEVIVSLFGRRLYDGSVPLYETTRLIAWFREEGGLRNQGILTDLTVGPMLKCYAGAAIALQPQFGLERIRRPTQEFLHLIYHGTERELAEYCGKLNMEYFLFNDGYLSNLGIYTERYIADAVKIPARSPLNMMKYNEQKLVWFYPVDPPRRFQKLEQCYRVYKVIRPDDKIQAMRLLFEAQDQFLNNRKAEAKRTALRAFLLDPASEQLRIWYFRKFGRIPRLGLNGKIFYE